MVRALQEIDDQLSAAAWAWAEVRGCGVETVVPPLALIDELLDERLAVARAQVGAF